MKYIILVTLLLFTYCNNSFCQNNSDNIQKAIKLKLAGDSIKKHSAEEAVKYYTAAIELYEDYDTAYFERGNQLNVLYRNDEAIADFTKCIEVSPNFWLGYFGRGVSLSILDNKSAAILDLNKAVELFPENDTSIKFYKSVLYYYLAVTKSVLKYSHDEITKDLRIALETDKYCFPIYRPLAYLHVINGKFDKAIDLCNQAIINHVEYMKNEGLYDNDYDQAIYDIYNYYGRLLYKKERFKEADDIYTQGLEYYPNDKVLYHNRGLARIQYGNTEGAYNDFDHCKQ